MVRKLGSWMVMVSICLSCAKGQEAEPATPVTSTATPKGSNAEEVVATSQEPKTQVLELGSSIWEPFTGPDPAPHLATDIVREALRRAGVAVGVKVTPAERLTEELNSPDYDGWDALWKSDERAETFLFSEPYLENRLVLLARAETDVSAERLPALAGKTLGVVRGYAYGPRLAVKPGPELVFGKDDATNLEALLRGDLDYILVEELLVHQLFASEPERAERLLAAGTTSLVSRGLHLALRKDLEGAETTLQNFNRQLQGLIRDGTYHELLRVGWISADTDHDGQPELILGGTHAGEIPPERHYRLFGASDSNGAQFVIEGQVYKDWQTVPERYKSPPAEGLDRFQPPFALVLMKF